MDYRERWELKEYLVEQQLGRRVALIHAGILLLVLGYVLGFWYLQVVRGDEYAELAEINRLRRVPLMPTRGEVFDRHDVVLASTRPSLRLIFAGEATDDTEPQLRRLESALSVPYDSLSRRVEEVRARPDVEWAVLVEEVSLNELAPIEARREWYPSIGVEQVARRTYPAGEAVAHVLGYVGEVSEERLAEQDGERRLQRGDIVGKAGLERSYDDRLRGERGWQFQTVNNLGTQIGEGRTGETPRDGRPLRLTLDLRLQVALLDALGEEIGAGVFLEPSTGEVLALASSPSFDPNLFAGGITPEAWNAIVHDRRDPLHDRALASYYAPGSTFKIVMAAAGLEHGTITPQTTVHCTGGVRMYGRRFLCWKRGGHGTVNLHKALVHSCNVYFYQLGKELGLEPIHEYGARFGLGRPTGIDLPGEVAGILPSDAWKREVQGERWYPGETISVSIGQGLLAVTPLQMAVMVSGVATSGTLPTPFLVQGRGQPGRPVGLAPATLQHIRRALEEVVLDGTGRSASMGSIAVAGKTGTAQVYKHSAGVDSAKLPKHERDHAWFVGYAPADSPEVAFAVVVEHGGHGGTAAAPVARKVLEAYFAERMPQRPQAGAAVAGYRRIGVDGVGTTAAR